MANLSALLNNANPYAYSAELEWMHNYGKSLGDRAADRVVMLGAGPGVLLIALLEGCPDTPIPVTVVDIDTTHWVHEHLKSISHCAQITEIISDSALSGKLYLREPVNLLIVDAAHDRKSVEADIDAWLPHVRVGGFVFFHDYLEREGGFNGSGEWLPSDEGVAGALDSRMKDNPCFKWAGDIGISRTYRRVC